MMILQYHSKILHTFIDLKCVNYGIGDLGHYKWNASVQSDLSLNGYQIDYVDQSEAQACIDHEIFWPFASHFCVSQTVCSRSEYQVILVLPSSIEVSFWMA